MLQKARRRFRWQWLCVGLLITVLVWLGVSAAVALRLTSRREPPFPEPPPTVDWGVLEPLRLETLDEQSIGAWYCAGGHPEGPAVLLLHGNGGSRRSSLSRARFLANLGCSVLLISLRSHGDSTGLRNDIGYSARFDVVSAVQELSRRDPERPIIIWGSSLGSAAASFAAPLLGSSVDGYILECPYQDLLTAVWNRTDTYLPSVLGPIAYLGLRSVAPIILPTFLEIAPLRTVAAIPSNVPVLIMAGEDDSLARPAEAQALYEAVSTHAELVLFPKGRHMKLEQSNSFKYHLTLLRFLQPFFETRF